MTDSDAMALIQEQERIRAEVDECWNQLFTNGLIDEQANRERRAMAWAIETGAKP